MLVVRHERDSGARHTIYRRTCPPPDLRLASALDESRCRAAWRACVKKSNGKIFPTTGRMWVGAAKRGQTRFAVSLVQDNKHEKKTGKQEFSRNRKKNARLKRPCYQLLCLTIFFVCTHYSQTAQHATADISPPRVRIGPRPPPDPHRSHPRVQEVGKSHR